MNSHLGQLFSRAYIIGGSPCSGKSTVAERLAAEYDLHYYKVDEHDGVHLQRCQPEQQPVMFKYSQLSWEAIWAQPVTRLLADELAYYHERFPLILADLFQIDPEKPILLEGAAFLPELVKQFAAKPKNVVFMVPTPDFQIQHYRQRPWIKGILDECRDPAQAFAHWMQRDILFGQEVTRQAGECGFPVIRVDGSVNIIGQYDTLRNYFGF
jgi:2-phosphoglycerate kinase